MSTIAFRSTQNVRPMKVRVAHWRFFDDGESQANPTHDNRLRCWQFDPTQRR